jgi:microcin C transport system substrate-binding protein
MMRIAVFLIALLLCCSAVQAKHALTLFGEPKYKVGFKHFDYVNPAAPKGGQVKLAYPLTFDSLNPFILKGLAAPDISQIYDTLMTVSFDEPQTYYGLIADDVSVAADGTSVTFRINGKARWHDGTPITAEDVAFTLNILKEKGHPLYQLRYKEVDKAEVLSARLVRFHFNNTENRELPFIVASLPVLPKAYWEKRDFQKSSLDIPLASGPYYVKSIEPARSIVYERVEDYWAKDLPVRVGQYNFDTIRYDIYRDETVALEAFKSHEYDMREEYIARNWALAYNFKAVKEGRVIIDNTPNKIPRGMQAFMFNLRKDRFKDRRVREAIAQTFDFEWMNRTLFYSAYERNNSFFQNTDFAAKGKPSDAEKALLEPYKNVLPEAIYGDVVTPPVSDGSGFIRDRLIKADKLLKAAGWIIREGVRVHEKTGEVMTIEMLARQSSMEKLVAAMRRNLLTLGIEVKFRPVDDSQYQKRLQHYDYDMTVIWWNLGITFPGSEQRGFWHSSQVDIAGAQNLSGYASPAVDMLLEKIGNAKDYQELLTASRALDRILLHEHIVIPHFSISHFRMAYWDIFGIPKIRPAYGRAFETWWMK